MGRDGRFGMKAEQNVDMALIMDKDPCLRKAMGKEWVLLVVMFDRPRD